MKGNLMFRITLSAPLAAGAEPQPLGKIDVEPASIGPFLAVLLKYLPEIIALTVKILAEIRKPDTQIDDGTITPQ